MPYDLSNHLVIAISSRALFDLSKENDGFVKDGVEAYSKYQLEHENEVLNPGIGFGLVKGLLKLNEYTEGLEGNKKTEVIIMSRNNADTSLRIFHSIEHYNLNITRTALTSGKSIVPYLGAFSVDLFLSANESDVQDAINAGFAAGLIYGNESSYQEEDLAQIRIAFDGDAVIFSDESEKIFKEQGLEAFTKHEKENAKTPLSAGPFAKLLQSISTLQMHYGNKHDLIRTALVTARCSPTDERVIRTLREWGVRIDEAFFLGGAPKEPVLKAFGAHIFFDDQEKHLSKDVPSAKVLYKDNK